MITFAHPHLLWLLATLPILAWCLGRPGKTAALRYSNIDAARKSARRTRSHWGALFRLARWTALALLVVGLARPQFGRHTSEIQSSGVDLMLAVDVSGSMEARDLAQRNEPLSRLDVVKSVVAQFIADRPNDRIGLIAFAGAPFLVSPLTLDHDWLLQNLSRLHTGMVEDGTAIGSALASASNRLRSQSSKSKLIVLLTDGENNAGKIQPELAAKAAHALGIKAYTIGVGARGEAPMPITDANGRTHMAMVKVDVDEKTLSDIAQTTGGNFYRATDAGSLSRIYSAIDRMEKTTRTQKIFAHHDERFAWFVMPALMLLLMEVGLGLTRFRRVP